MFFFLRRVECMVSKKMVIIVIKGMFDMVYLFLILVFIVVVLGWDV